MANPKPSKSRSSNTSSLSNFWGGNNNLNNNNNNIYTPTTESVVLNFVPISSHITRSSSPKGTWTITIFASSLSRQPRSMPSWIRQPSTNIWTWRKRKSHQATSCLRNWFPLIWCKAFVVHHPWFKTSRVTCWDLFRTPKLACDRKPW